MDIRYNISTYESVTIYLLICIIICNMYYYNIFINMYLLPCNLSSLNRNHYVSISWSCYLIKSYLDQTADKSKWKYAIEGNKDI